MRQHDAVEVRVVGLWKRAAREPWWLATNTDLPLGRLAAFYDRRMAIEEQFRDTKGARFGFADIWTQVKTPDAPARFLLLVGITIFLLTAVGQAIAEERPDVRLPCKIKGPRLSVLNVALFFGSTFTFSTRLSTAVGAPGFARGSASAVLVRVFRPRASGEPKARPLTRFIVQHLPPPALRDFPWLHKFEKAS